MFGLTNMKRLVIIGMFFLIGCSPMMKPVEHVASPSGEFIVAAIPYEGKTDPRKNGCLRLILESRSGITLSAVQTGVSDGQKWAIGWMEEGDVVVLQSSDIGTQAFGVISNSLSQVTSTPEIEARAIQLKKAKYGR